MLKTPKGTPDTPSRTQKGKFSRSKTKKTKIVSANEKENSEDQRRSTRQCYTRIFDARFETFMCTVMCYSQ